jgi:hypothetical protein
VRGDEQAQRLIDEPEARRELTATEAAELFLTRIEESCEALNAFVTVTPELALADARRADEARARGQPLPLDGDDRLAPPAPVPPRPDRVDAVTCLTWHPPSYSRGKPGDTKGGSTCEG